MCMQKGKVMEYLTMPENPNSNMCGGTDLTLCLDDQEKKQLTSYLCPDANVPEGEEVEQPEEEEGVQK